MLHARRSERVAGLEFVVPFRVTCVFRRNGVCVCGGCVRLSVRECVVGRLTRERLPGHEAGTGVETWSWVVWEGSESRLLQAGDA